MDFELNEEQRLLKDSVERLLSDHYDFEQRKAYMKEPDGFHRDMWRRYAELGILGLPFDEKHGGSGGGAVETMIVAEAFGRALALEPYLPTVVLAGGLLRHGGTNEQRGAILPKVADGSLLLAFAHMERQSRYDLADVGATAKRDGAAFVVNAEKSVVLNGDAPGVTRRGYETVDGLRAADISFAQVKVGAEGVVGEAGAALPLIERVVDEAIAALAAEAVGAMAVMHELTVDYLRTRRQFDRPIGSFQVLQHRAVDMFVALEQARSMAMLATMMAEEPDAAERRKAIAAAKVQIGRSGRIVGHGAIQLHGGIGMTMEYKVGHYFKRVTAIDTTFGDADHHLGALARTDGLVPSLS